ncbi:MAG: IclR family transcriptional regulator [Ideonella sp. MAG2]|nr:MAG: IclR family transcriptional regulator [Ideonella sp. MAG2]
MPRRPRLPALADDHPAEGGVATLDRALSILTAFTAARPTPTLAELAAHTRMPKSTVLRMLASLQHAGLVLRLNDNCYALGAAVERLQRVRASSVSVESLVMPVLRELATATGESASYYVRQGQQRLCLWRVDSQRPVRDHLQVGALLPLNRGAAGRVLLAFAGEKGAVYATIRREGVAVLAGDRDPDVAGIAAPVFEAQGLLAGALSLSMPTQRLLPRHTAPVKAAAAKLSRLMGGEPHA